MGISRFLNVVPRSLLGRFMFNPGYLQGVSRVCSRYVCLGHVSRVEVFRQSLTFITRDRNVHCLPCIYPSSLIHTHAHSHTHIRAHTRTCTHAYTNTHTRTCTHTHSHAYVHIHAHTHMHTHAHTITHTHTQRSFKKCFVIVIFN